MPQTTRVEDDHLPFMEAGVPSVDIIDLDYDAWHTQRDTSMRSAPGACKSLAMWCLRPFLRSKPAWPNS